MALMVTRDIQYNVRLSCGHKVVFKAPAPVKGSTLLCTRCPTNRSAQTVEEVK